MMIKLRIMNESGHTELQLESREVIDQIHHHPTHWLFVNGELTARESIEQINWDEVQSVDLSPAIVGGAQ